MSWGERSCTYLFDLKKPCKPTLFCCNANCHFYEWDNTTVPDSKVIVSYPAVTSHRKCGKCGEEMRHHGWNHATGEAICLS
jgi:hypothetical protein